MNPTDSGTYENPIAPEVSTEPAVEPILIAPVPSLVDANAVIDEGEVDELQAAVESVREDTQWLRQQLTQSQTEIQGVRSELTAQVAQTTGLREEVRNLRESVVSRFTPPLNSQTPPVETPPENEGGQQDQRTAPDSQKKRRRVI